MPKASNFRVLYLLIFERCFRGLGVFFAFAFFYFVASHFLIYFLFVIFVIVLFSKLKVLELIKISTLLLERPTLASRVPLFLLGHFPTKECEISNFCL